MRFRIVVDVWNECLEVGDGVMGDVEVYGALFVNLVWQVCFLDDRQFNDEGGTLAQLAVAADGAVVEIDEIVGEAEAETCADGLVLAVFTVVESLEEVEAKFEKNYLIKLTVNQ